MAGKFYAVRKGRTPGIYNTWDICKSMTEGFQGAEYKSFKTREEAESYMSGGSVVSAEEPKCYAFVDGSYNIAAKVYGYGGFLMIDGQKEYIQGSGDDEEMASMRNVAGELEGSMAAIRRAVELGVAELTIYYDYMGIEMWATGAWKRNKMGTIAYHDYINSIRDQITLHFVKVKGHSGVTGNEEADKLAKEAAGVE